MTSVQNLFQQYDVILDQVLKYSDPFEIVEFLDITPEYRRYLYDYNFWNDLSILNFGTSIRDNPKYDTYYKEYIRRWVQSLGPDITFRDLPERFHWIANLTALAGDSFDAHLKNNYHVYYNFLGVEYPDYIRELMEEHPGEDIVIQDGDFFEFIDILNNMDVRDMIDPLDVSIESLITEEGTNVLDDILFEALTNNDLRALDLPGRSMNDFRPRLHDIDEFVQEQYEDARLYDPMNTLRQLAFIINNAI